MWSGLPVSKEQAMEKYDVDEVKYTTELDLKGEVFGIPEQVDGRVKSSVKEEMKVKEAIEECRAYKDEYEVALIRHANEISTAAHEAVIEMAKNAENERELEAACLFADSPKLAHFGRGANASG